MSNTLVVAIGDQDIIGVNGCVLPWQIPADMRWFKFITLNRYVIMGRKTWESIPEKYKPLANRLNVVLTSNRNYKVPPGVIKIHDTAEMYSFMDMHDTCIIGGSAVYQLALKSRRLSDIYISRVGYNYFMRSNFPSVPDESFDRFITKQGATNIWPLNMRLRAKLELDAGLILEHYTKSIC